MSLPVRLLLALLFLAEACGLAASTTEREGERILEVPVFVGGYGIGFFQQTARDFEQERPGLRVNLYGDARIADKLGVRLLRGDTPDLSDANLPWRRLIESDAVLDLSAALDGPDWTGQHRWRDTFAPGVLDRWTIRGKVYAIPFAHAVWAFFYNKRLFEQEGWTPPRTWDEFFELCARQRASGRTPLAFPGQVMRYADPIWRHAYRTLAGPEAFARFVDMDPEVWKEPAMLRALGLLERLPREAFGPGWEGTSHTGAQRALLEGRAAMTLSGSWIASEMGERLPEGFELGAFNFPVFPDAPEAGELLQTGSGYYFIFRQGRNTEDAIDFLRFLTARERATAFSRASDSPTAILGSDAGLSPRMADTARLLRESAGTFDYPPQTVGPQAALAPALSVARQSLLLGRINAQEASSDLREATLNEQRRTADPTRVSLRHPGKAALFLGTALTLAVGIWILRRRIKASATDERPASPAVHALAFLWPAFLVYLVFLLVPSVVATGLSLQRWDGLGTPRFAGLEAFRWLLLESDSFWSALGNNLFLVVVPTACVLPTALVLAACLHRKVVGAGFFRSVILFPNLLGGIAGALIWMHAYEPSGGLVNAGLAWLGFEQAAQQAWLSPGLLYFALVPIHLWLATGFNVVLLLAAMQAVEGELYDAAAIDGAGPWRTFLSVTLPGIRGTVLVAAVFLALGGIHAFELVWLLTGQDPPASLHTLGTLMVHTLFREFQIGRAAALAVVMALLVLLATGVLRAIGSKEESG